MEGMEIAGFLAGGLLTVSQLYIASLVKNMDGKIRGINDLLSKDIDNMKDHTNGQIDHVNMLTIMRVKSRDQEMDHLKKDIARIEADVEVLNRAFEHCRMKRITDVGGGNQSCDM